MRVFLLLCALAAARASAQEVPDLPDSVSAVQERAFRMQHEVALSVGMLPLDPFSKGLFAQGSYTAHFSDFFAWQVARGAYSYTLKTELRGQLERDFGFLPTAFEEIQFFFGSDILIKPLYGKLTVMNKVDVHGELFVILGATLFKFTTALRPGVNLGIGARIFMNRTLSLRLDITDNVDIPLGAGQTLTNVMAMSLSLGINIGATE